MVNHLPDLRVEEGDHSCALLAAVHEHAGKRAVEAGPENASGSARWGFSMEGEFLAGDRGVFVVARVIHEEGYLLLVEPVAEIDGAQDLGHELLSKLALEPREHVVVEALVRVGRG